MAKMVVHTKAAPAHPTDENVNVGQFQPGDVIAVLEDDIQFGSHDLGDWNAVLYLTDVPAEQLEHLSAKQPAQTTSVLGEDVVISSTARRVRMWSCPPDKLALLQEKYGAAPPFASRHGINKRDVAVQDLSGNFDATAFTKAYFIPAPADPDPKVFG